MPTKDFILLQLAQIKPQLRKHYGVSKIGLFGSYAKNCANESSDVDLLIEYAPNFSQNYQNLVKLESLLKKTLAFENIELVDVRYINPIIALEAQKSIIYV